MQTLNVSEDLSFKDIDDTEQKQLMLLVKKIGGRGIVYIDNEDVKSHVVWTKIANLNLLLFNELVDKDKKHYKIYDFFKYHLLLRGQYHEEGDYFNATKYECLSYQHYKSISNIDYKNMIKAYSNVLLENDRCLEMANVNLLNMLKAYDEMDVKKDLLINTAKELSEWIYVKEPTFISKINYLQTIKRIREFTSEEKLSLVSMLDEANINYIEKVGIYLLLDNAEQTECFFNKLEKLEQENLKAFPIYAFHKAKEDRN